MHYLCYPLCQSCAAGVQVVNVARAQPTECIARAARVFQAAHAQRMWREQRSAYPCPWSPQRRQRARLVAAHARRAQPRLQPVDGVVLAVLAQHHLLAQLVLVLQLLLRLGLLLLDLAHGLVRGVQMRQATAAAATAAATTAAACA